MPRKHLRFGRGFSIALRNARGQAATMVLDPGDCEGGPGNRHRGSDQWLYVLSGRGTALVAGRTPLKTLNLYVPPAYTSKGEPLPRGRK